MISFFRRGRSSTGLLATVLLAFGAATSTAFGDVALASLFTDHTVLQRDQRVPIWGTATAGEKVVASFQGKTAEATAAADGSWQAWFAPLAMSREGADLVVTGKNTVTLHDVVVGDVWLCSGQSNMGFTVIHARDAEKEIAAADFPLIRQLLTDRTIADEPARTVKTKGWSPASPKSVGAFTAVGFFFAREIHQRTGVPIGLLHSSWPGTPIEAWLAASARASNPAFAVVEDRYQQALAVFPEKNPPYLKALAAWQPGEAAARAQGDAARAAYVKAHPAPVEPVGPRHPYRPSGTFNGMIAPLMPYALRGFLWYQGEGNTGRYQEYAALFEALITDWRKQFGQGDLPFYWVQLPNFGAGQPAGTNWAWLREAQSHALRLPNTGQAIAIDVGEAENLHPTDKQSVGHRLALIVGEKQYGLKGPSAGPVFAKAEREGSTLRVHFRAAEGGLVVRGDQVTSLQLAGADHRFFPAVGRVEGDELIVTAPEVSEPAAVRYAWVNAPAANLYNQAGLPVAPFRSDHDSAP
jgi:sialate O-acetylesterase